MERETDELFRVLYDRPPSDVVKRCGVVFIPRRDEKGDRYLVNLLNETYVVDVQKWDIREAETEQVADEKVTHLILKYLLRWSPASKRGGWIILNKFLRDSQLINEYEKRVIRPLLDAFGYDVQTFESVCRFMNGQREKMGGISFSFDFFPAVKGGIQLWGGEQSTYKPPSANVLFEDRASSVFDGCELVDAAETLVTVVLKNRKKLRPK
ncbi:MAG: DUF3786 domain-containing protein [Aigarchaeota archaeon]|nr:DUF3786 domain-containing protein [Aigarchaeota archaeon]MDW8092825.1 DUF3786 domain-containing protein [Nitrososphaerota archaeon]